MKLLATILLLVSTHLSFSQLTHVSVEEIDHSGMVGSYDLTGYTTYRIFAHTASPDDAVISVSGGTVTCEAYIRTSSEGWFNSQLGANTGNAIVEALWPIDESSIYDTYITIGMASGNSLGVTLTQNDTGIIPFEGSGSVTTVGDAHQQFQQEGITGNSGGNLELDGPIGSSWFSLPGNPNNEPQGLENSVLLGQFTTDGVFSFALNIQVLGENQTEDAGEHRWCAETAVPGLTFSSSSGCTDNNACNYNPNVLEDDGTCTYPGDPCDDLDDTTIQEVYQDDCSCSGGIIGVAEMNPNAETILLYPNPMTDRAVLEFEDASTRTVRLLDSNGKEVRVWESVAKERIKITKGELAAGTYVVSVEADGSVQNLQLIVK
ncbi:MAG: T9SS type A sorting domain-containing protein [Flavobacteriales bacterium]